MMTDRFLIEHRGGRQSGPFKTKFGSGTILVFQDELEVSEGDLVIQLLPDGSERLYAVEGSASSNGSRNIPAHFSIRLSEPLETREAIASRNGGNPDGGSLPSLNAARSPREIAAAMQSLATAIDGSGFPSAQKEEASAALRALLEHPVVAAVLNGSGPA
jgi:hypothetical protein